jgi:GNAT superfamily N-acetyltransferase
VHCDVSGKIVSLRPTTGADLKFCETLSRDNMRGYREALGNDWDPERYRASWAEFENLVIELDGVPAGVLRMSIKTDMLEIRDLQVVPERIGQGLGSWALSRALALARARGHAMLGLRVFADNPALRPYMRFGFELVRREGGLLHMSRSTLSEQPDAVSGANRMLPPDLLQCQPLAQFTRLAPRYLDFAAVLQP